MLTTRAPGSRFAAFLRSGRRAVDQETKSLGSGGAGQGQPLGDGPVASGGQGVQNLRGPLQVAALFEQLCRPRDRGTAAVQPGFGPAGPASWTPGL
jgi:hypothetical protein